MQVQLNSNEELQNYLSDLIKWLDSYTLTLDSRNIDILYSPEEKLVKVDYDDHSFVTVSDDDLENNDNNQENNWPFFDKTFKTNFSAQQKPKRNRITTTLCTWTDEKKNSK